MDLQEVAETLQSVMDVASEEEEQLEKLLDEDEGELDAEAKGAAIGAARLLSAYKEQLSPKTLSAVGKLLGLGEGEDEEKLEDKPEEDEEEDELKAKADDEDDEENPNLKAKLKALWDANKRFEKRTKQLEDELKAERDERNRREFVAKAKDKYSVVGEADEIGMVLKMLHDGDADLAEKVESIFDAIQGRLESSELLSTKSRVRTSQSSTGAWSQIQAKAKSLVESGEAKTVADGVDKVLLVDRQLSAQYLKERAS